jgi:hypothetical protein
MRLRYGLSTARMNHTETVIGMNHGWELDIFLGRTGTVGIIRGLFREHPTPGRKRGMDGQLFFSGVHVPAAMPMPLGGHLCGGNRHGTQRETARTIKSGPSMIWLTV